MVLVENLGTLDESITKMSEALVAAQPQGGSGIDETADLHDCMRTYLPTTIPNVGTGQFSRVAHMVYTLRHWYDRQTTGYDQSPTMTTVREIQNAAIYVLSLLHEFQQFYKRVAEGHVGAGYPFADPSYQVEEFDAGYYGNYTDALYVYWQRYAHKFSACIQPPNSKHDGGTKLGHVPPMRSSYVLVHKPENDDDDDESVGMMNVERKQLPFEPKPGKTSEKIVKPIGPEGRQATYVQTDREYYLRLRALGFSNDTDGRNFSMMYLGAAMIQAAVNTNAWLSLQLFKDQTEGAS